MPAAGCQPLSLSQASAMTAGLRRLERVDVLVLGDLPLQHGDPLVLGLVLQVPQPLQDLQLLNLDPDASGFPWGAKGPVFFAGV